MGEPTSENATTEKSSTGLDANVAGALSYALWWITGLVFFLIEKDSKFVKFHAMRSIVLLGGVTLFNIVVSVIIPFIGWLIAFLVWLGAVVMWIVLMVMAFQGKKFKLPLIGDFAEKQAG